jgi:OOP family OmpA-OmpF porin
LFFGVFFAPMTGTRKLFAAIAALAACTPAWAQDTGFYVGGALGQASYREVCRDFDTLVGVAGAFACQGERDTAGKVFAGWRFLRFLAAELSYIDYGEVKAQGTVSGAMVTATSGVRAAGISALGILPLGERLSVFGRLGLLQSKTRMQSAGAVTAANNHDETELHVGIGGMFQMTRGWALRAEYERLNDTRIDLSTLGVQYQF